MNLQKIKKFIIRVVELYLSNDLPVFSASAAFFLIIASIPLAMLIVSTLSLLPMVDIEDFERHVNLILPNIPYAKYIIDYILGFARKLASSHVVYLNIITSLISGSTVLFSFVVGIKKVYKVKSEGGFIKVRLMAIFNIVILYFIIIFTMLFFVVGRVLLDYVDRYVPFVAKFVSVIMDYKYFTIGIFMTILSLSLYHGCSNHKGRYLDNIYGALFTTIGWLIVANLFSLYFRMSSMTRDVSQSIYGIIILLAWLFVSVNLVFIGACINETVREFKAN